MGGQQIEHALAILDPAAGRDAVAEDGLRAAVVHHRREAEAGFGGAADRPPGERSRHLDDVLLCVAAIDAQRVQLEQLARVVLVEPAHHARLRPLASTRRRLPPRLTRQPAPRRLPLHA